MTPEQQAEDIAKRTKTELPVLISPQLVELKIKAALTKEKLSIVDLEQRALKLVKNEDHLKEMADLLKDLKAVDDKAEEVFKTVKQPYWDAGKACDAGKKLALDVTASIRKTFQPRYNELLQEVAEKKRKADQKKLQDAAILQGIEANVINFSNLVIAAITRKQLTDVESRINLEKSPTRAAKYGEFHQKAIQRYDEVLLPIIKDQKRKVEELEGLNKQLTEAENNNDPDKMDVLMEKIDNISDAMIHNHSIIQEAALNQDSFPVEHATEVLPAFKVKRTNYSFEIADLDVAIKKARGLLDITVNNGAAREVLEGLKEKNAFEGKDEVIVDGIKYIATRVREAL